MGSQFCSKFIRRIDRRIDVAAKLFLSRRYRMHDILEWCCANHQEVDVARRPKVATRG
jgi:hypothetical protein